MKPAAIGLAAILVIAVSAASAPDAHGATTSPERRCQKARLDAAAKYLSCHQKALGKAYATDDATDLQRSLGRCRVKYQSTWPKLQASPTLAGTSCAQPRFVDQGDGTVLDNLTTLVWERKTDDDGLRDKDDVYTWSTAGSVAETGSAFSTFLPALDGEIFGGSAGWRMPTLAELQTIMPGAFPCASPCIDPLFGLASGTRHFTSTSGATAETVWFASFADGQVGFDAVKELPYAVRAVRGRM